MFNPFLPQFTKLYVDGEIKAFKAMFHKILLALVALTVVVLIGAALVGRMGLSILFGNEILAHYNLFMPIVMCTILTAAIWILSAIVIAIRQIRALLIRNGAKVKEVQVQMMDRVAGESYLNLSRSINYMTRMFVSILILQWFREV